MSFDSHGGGPEKVGQTSECKPDYEKQAAEMKKKIDARSDLQKALFNFSNLCGTYDFRKISSFAELVGGITLHQQQAEASYNELLIRIEKDQ